VAQTYRDVAALSKNAHTMSVDQLSRTRHQLHARLLAASQVLPAEEFAALNDSIQSLTDALASSTEQQAVQAIKLKQQEVDNQHRQSVMLHEMATILNHVAGGVMTPEDKTRLHDAANQDMSFAMSVFEPVLHTAHTMVKMLEAGHAAVNIANHHKKARTAPAPAAPPAPMPVAASTLVPAAPAQTTAQPMVDVAASVGASASSSNTVVNAPQQPQQPAPAVPAAPPTKPQEDVRSAGQPSMLIRPIFGANGTPMPAAMSASLLSNSMAGWERAEQAQRMQAVKTQALHDAHRQRQEAMERQLRMSTQARNNAPGGWMQPAAIAVEASAMGGSGSSAMQPPLQQQPPPPMTVPMSASGFGPLQRSAFGGDGGGFAGAFSRPTGGHADDNDDMAMAFSARMGQRGELAGAARSAYGNMFAS
jgi:hypothetical protein